MGPGGRQYGTHTIPESALIGKATKYLLIIETGGSASTPGRVMRFASERLTIVDRTGEEFDFRPGLSIPELTLGEGDVSVGIVLDGSPEDSGWIRLFASGTDLEGARGLLLQWTEGLAILERARVLVSGVLTGPAYGDPKSPDRLEISLESIPLDTKVQIVDPDAVVEAGETWPVQTPFNNYNNWATGTDENLPRAEGLPYPLVLGRPRWTPGLIVERRNNNEGTLLISADHVRATTVTIWDRTDKIRGSASVSLGFDRNKFRVSTVDPADVPGMVVDNSHEYVVDWTDTEGGIPNIERTGDNRGGGEIILWALLGMQGENRFFRVDVGRCQAARQILDGYKFDTYIQNGDYMSWLRSEILPFLPVELVEGPGGWYPLVWRWGAVLRDAVARLVVRGTKPDGTYADGNCVRMGAVLRSHTYQGVRNRFVLSYRARDYPRPATKRAVLGPRTDARSAYVCRRSRARFGGIKTWTGRAQAIDDTATARSAIEWRALRDALPRDIVGLQMPLAIGGHLERGDVVSFADETGPHPIGTEASPRVGLIRSLRMVDTDLFLGVDLLQTGPITGTDRDP